MTNDRTKPRYHRHGRYHGPGDRQNDADRQRELLRLQREYERLGLCGRGGGRTKATAAGKP